MTEVTYSFDATQQNFETDVIQASLQQPVLVDFWATWCAPCTQLKPILEKLAADYAGAFSLAKVDTDQEMAIAGMFGVRSLPTVVLVKGGQVVDGFMGALPESGVRQFLEKHDIAPNAAQQPIIDTVLAAEAPEYTIARLQQEIAAHADKPELKLDLALAYLRAGNALAAQAELDVLPTSLADDEKAKRVRNQLDFISIAKSAPPIEELRARIEHNPADLEARDFLGVRLLVAGEAASAMDQFLEVFKINRTWNDNLAKKRLIAAFNMIEHDELVGAYRRKMSALVF